MLLERCLVLHVDLYIGFAEMAKSYTASCVWFILNDGDDVDDGDYQLAVVLV